VVEPLARIFPNVPRPLVLRVVEFKVVTVPFVEKKLVVVAEVPVAFVKRRFEKLFVPVKALLSPSKVEEAALMVIFEVPSNATPLIFLAV
jgi:hypothetical protein